VVLLGIGLIWAIRRVDGKKGKRPDGPKKGKGKRERDN